MAIIRTKDLYSELELECSSRNSSPNEFFVIDFQNSILTSFFRNFWKVWNRTNSEFSVNSECSETPVFYPKTPVFVTKTGNYFCTYLRTIFASSKRLDIFKKFPNFDNRTIPKLAKKKSSENSIFRRTLIRIPLIYNIDTPS